MKGSRAFAALRALAAALALALLPSACADRPGAAPGALVVVRDADSGPRLVSALKQALALKEAGLDTRVLFEAGAVLAFVRPLPARAPAPALHTRDWAGGAAENEAGAALEAQTLAELTEKVPYIICSFSAGAYGVYDELKAAGRPLSASAQEPADLTRYLNEGFEVYVY